MIPLPYPGFSWSMSQHIGPGTERNALFELLQAAYAYSGSNTEDAADKITGYLEEQGVFPPNVRQDAGRSQIWRDYQQVLSELGLIISSRFTSQIILTPIALMWLDGLIGYSELITTQCLRYQYPNGHKRDLSPTQKDILAQSGLSVPDTRTELDKNFGVLIKPAVLILRVLLELTAASGRRISLRADQCLEALVPTRTNNNWNDALSEVIGVMQSDTISASSDTRRLRHVQEWFRLLQRSDLFDVSRSGISLSDTSMENTTSLLELCNFHEDPTTFWIHEPSTPEELGISWYQYFGNPSIWEQWLAPEDKRDSSYVAENYPTGAEPKEEPMASIPPEQNYLINLRPFAQRSFDFDLKPDTNSIERLQRLVDGQTKQQSSSKLHERIVSMVAARLESNGYGVSMDPQSVDLLAIKNRDETILEVKTVNRTNLDSRIRLGVGQLSEYRYRRQLETKKRPQGILVLSSPSNFPEWFLDYMSKDISLGLVSLQTAESFTAYTNGKIEGVLSDLT